ncbi:hypothetical protein [Polyangium sorediatum]|uniref:Virion structural protein n=1 Tax=Polyangium sorediatum TaxID=889274 RepID=A0ABT6PA49_9BACT|nr:hypothetical protein [Polyangium sorediatum]MDI1437453.1 hypothetical protein [Polyangium sorediatum]
MATEYSITINMDDATVNTLTDRGFRLYGFKGVKTGAAGGAPVVWIETTQFSKTTVIKFTEEFQAFTSRYEDLNENVQIVSSADYPIDLGQTLNITGANGTGAVEVAGPATAISVYNKVTQEFNCGISQKRNGQFNPLCAVPINGLNLNRFVPIQLVFLAFATQKLNLGTVILQSFTQGGLIDLTGAPGNTRSVTYEKNTGWSFNNEPWGKQIGANENLVQYLIQQDARLATK